MSSILMSSMKSVVLSLIVAVALIVPARATECQQNPDKCGTGECCVEDEGIRKCRPRPEEGGMCNPRSTKPSDGVYRKRCPCRRKDLTCGTTKGSRGFRCVAEN